MGGEATQVPPQAHILVRALFVEMGRQGWTVGRMAHRSGVGESTIQGWKGRRCQAPTIVNLASCYQVLGYDLVPRARVVPPKAP